MQVFCLDDERMGPRDWMYSRSMYHGIAVIEQHDPFDVWWLDHDLGGSSPSGLDFLKAIHEKDLVHKLPKEIKVHSMNPVGAQYMVYFCQDVLGIPVTRAIFPKEA